MFKEDEDLQSYVCDVCQHTDAADEIYIDQTEQKECWEGHNFCKQHIGNVKITSLNQIKELFDDYIGDHNSDNNYHIWLSFSKGLDIESVIKEIAHGSLNCSNSADNGFSDIFCPVCNLQEISDHDLLNYILNTRKLSRETIMEEIRATYGNYEKLQFSGLLHDKEYRNEKCSFELCLDSYSKEQLTLAALYGWFDLDDEIVIMPGCGYREMFDTIFAFITLDDVGEECDEKFIKNLLFTYFADYEPDKMFAMYQKNKTLKKLE